MTYTLDVTGANSFDINPATGQITVGPRTTLDTETDAEFMVMVTATDPWNMAVMQNVTITIKDVNEAPTMTVGATRVSREENTGITTAVSAYTATDPESSDGTCVVASCTWSVSGTDAGDFKISNAETTFGALTFKKAPTTRCPRTLTGTTSTT